MFTIKNQRCDILSFCVVLSDPVDIRWKYNLVCVALTDIASFIKNYFAKEALENEAGELRMKMDQRLLENAALSGEWRVRWEKICIVKFCPKLCEVLVLSSLSIIRQNRCHNTSGDV